MHSTALKVFVAIFIVLAAITGISLNVQNKNSNQEQLVLKSPEGPQQPVFAATEDQVSTSLDGTKKLIMKQTRNDSDTSYSIYTQTGDELESILLSKTATGGESFTVPQNAWSPEEKYIFINGNNNGEAEVFVLKADGTLFSDSKQEIDIAALFNQTHTDYTFDEATGWAAPTLLIVESLKPDGSTGPSFWFDASTEKFIQLSRHQ